MDILTRHRAAIISRGRAIFRGIVFSLCAFAPLAATPAQDLILSGTVRDQRTGIALSGASVQVRRLETAEIVIVTTGQDGAWACTLATTGLRGPDRIPDQIALLPNYPNPFNPSTTLPFTLNTSGTVRIAVHTVLGQELDSREFTLEPGSYAIPWQSRGAAGVLFYSISLGDTRITRRMVQLDGGSGAGLGVPAPGGTPALYRPPGTEDLLAGAAHALQGTAQASVYRITALSLVCEPESVDIDAAVNTRADLLLSTIHDRAFVIDLHNDVMEKVVGQGYQIGPRHTYNHTDIPRMRDGGLDAQWISVYVEAVDTAIAYTKALAILNAYQQQLAANPADIGPALNAADVDLQNAAGRIAAPLILEGGYALHNDLANLRDLYGRGIRMMTITWNNSLSWAVAAADARSATVGLSDFGRDVIRTMDSLGMIIDVSHTGIRTIEDILAVTKNPVIASHSGVRALRNHYRNLSDAQIRAIAARGGVIGMVFYPPFLSSTGSASIATVLNHIDYIRNLVGVDYIALGSDFDGIGTNVVSGLEDVSRFPALTEALLKRGYTREEVRKILGENFMRVFRAVCK